MESERHSDGPPDSVRAAADVLRSRRHAAMLFEAVVAQVGALGWQETANGGAIRRLFRRDAAAPTQIVPWPVLELSTSGRFGVVTDWMALGDTAFAAEVPQPQPAMPPKLRGLGPGEIRLLDGAEYIEIVYDDAGAKLETCRSNHPRPLAGLAPALAAAGAHPIELLTQFVAALDPGRHGPGRVLVPAAVPHGIAGVWLRGLYALRRALFADAVPRDARWAVADGLTGTVLAFGPTATAALARWRDALSTQSPWPEQKPSLPPPTDLPPGTMLIQAPSPDVPMPPAVPANVPAVVVPLEPVPARAPTSGSWTTLLGACGATSFAACRRKRKGFTLIGQQVLAAVDFDRLDDEMDRADAEHEARMRGVAASTPGGLRRWPCRTTSYRLADAGRLAMDRSGEGAEWHAGDLDGDELAHRVVRQRWVEPRERDPDA